MTDFAARDLLAAETAHLSTRDKEAITACLAYAQRLAHAAPANVERAVVIEAIALKLFTLACPPERWVRTLIAKAALEAPVAWTTEKANTALMEAAERALRTARA